MVHRHRLHLGRPLVAGLLVLGACQAQGQTVDLVDLQARIGAPLRAVLQLRTPGVALDFQPDRCVTMRLQQGTEGQQRSRLTVVRVRALGPERWEVETLDAGTVQEPVLALRVQLDCGLQFTREFTLLAEPPQDAAAVAARVDERPAAAPPPERSERAAPSSWPADEAAAGRAAPEARPARSVRAAPPAGAGVPPSATGTATVPALALPAGADALSARAVLGAAQAAVQAAEAASQAASQALAAMQVHNRVLQDEQRALRASVLELNRRASEAEAQRDDLQRQRSTAIGVGGLVLGLLALGLLWRATAGLRPARQPAPVHEEPVPSSYAESVVLPSDLPQPEDAWDSDGRQGGRSVGVVQARTAMAIPVADVHDPPQDELPETLHGEPISGLHDVDLNVDELDALEPGDAEEGGGETPPILDDHHHQDLFRTIDEIAAKGAVGAAVALLENALIGRIGRSPGVLLRLLDHYTTLRQGANRERVLRELLALYNLGAETGRGPHEGPLLWESGTLWSSVEEAWSSPWRAGVYASMLLRPSPYPALSLAAFRDLVWLYGLVRVMDGDDRAGVQESPVGSRRKA